MATSRALKKKPPVRTVYLRLTLYFCAAMNITQILFWVLSVTALFSAVMVITSKNPVYSVLWLIVTFFTISGHYILLNAQFLAIVNIIVYAGAIMVLFLFVIMLMNLKQRYRAAKKQMAEAGRCCGRRQSAAGAGSGPAPYRSRHGADGHRQYRADPKPGKGVVQRICGAFRNQLRTFFKCYGGCGGDR
jgi:uncharacterized MnhB-related membrane protein